MLKKIMAGLALAFLLLALVSCAKKESTKLVFATDATFPPMESIDDSKNIVGFDIDLMNAVAKAGGFTVEFKNTAWTGIFAGLENGEYAAIVSSVTINDERKVKYDFSVPYINAGQVLVVRSETAGVTTLADLKGKKVGAQIGTTGAMEIEKVKDANKIDEKTYDAIGLAFVDLVNGRIDAIVIDTPVAGDYVSQNKDYTGKLKVVGTAMTEEYYGVVVRKGDTKTLDLVNAGLKKVLGTDEYKAIEDKWLK
jgi:polar amino acid transport system substrate-binding protein